MANEGRDCGKKKRQEVAGVRDPGLEQVRLEVESQVGPSTTPGSQVQRKNKNWRQKEPGTLHGSRNQAELGSQGLGEPGERPGTTNRRYMSWEKPRGL